MAKKASVRWTGLDELRAQLRQLPEELAQEGGAIVQSYAEIAQAAIQRDYAEVTGTLRARVVIGNARNISRYGSAAVVRSTAPHAWLYEHGTEGRRSYSGTDKRGRVFDKADRGKMPAAPKERQAIPKFVTWRPRMYAALAAMLERHGLRVSGSIGRAA